jgi:hypothetical protein
MQKEEREPFRYSSPPKVGYNKTIGKYPEYLSDPIKKRVRQINQD